MAPPELEELMAKAVNAYRNGQPVVVISSADEPLHGREVLETVRDLAMPLEAFFVKGVDVKLWNTSEYPEMLEAARKLFMEGKEW
jgi:hypothetical protein